jgi:hypothetical protein
MLVFVFFPLVSEREFRGAIEQMKPASIVDLRPAPRFDLGRLDRREALGIFEKIGARYVDIGTALGIEGCGDLTLLPMWIQNKAVPFTESDQSRADGPVMFLLNEEITGRSAVDAIAAALSAKHPWTIVELPQAPALASQKSDLIAL